MAAKTTKAVTTAASAEALAELANLFPQADSINRTIFPKLVFKSQTVLNEDEEVVIKAGTFFIERPTEEEDKNNKKVWEKVELGKSLDAHIIYHRKRLQMWDAKAEEFYSTPMFDKGNDIIPLFKAGEFVAEGTPGELKALFPEAKEYVDKKTGETKIRNVSKLRDAKVMYVLVAGELLEFTLQGTSLWSFEDYLKKFAVHACITSLNSTKEENGATKWNKVSFKVARDPNAEETALAISTVRGLLEGIEAEKEFYARKRMETATGAVATGAVAALPQGETGDDEEDF